MMNEKTELLEKAYAARDLYIIGEITREEALEHITPYVKAFNEKSKEIAKRYEIKKPKLINESQFLRQ